MNLIRTQEQQLINYKQLHEQSEKKLQMISGELTSSQRHGLAIEARLNATYLEINELKKRVRIMMMIMMMMMMMMIVLQCYCVVTYVVTCMLHQPPTPSSASLLPLLSTSSLLHYHHHHHHHLHQLHIHHHHQVSHKAVEVSGAAEDLMLMTRENQALTSELVEVANERDR